MRMERRPDDRSERDRVFDTYLLLFVIPFGIGIVLQIAQNPESSAFAGYGLLGSVVAGVLCAGYAVRRVFAKYAED